MENCKKCKQPIVGEDEKIMCDSCKDIFHYIKDKKNCANLTTTEYRAIILVKRDIIYFCADCKNAFKSVPVILRKLASIEKAVDDVVTKVNTIKEQMKVMEEEIEACSTSGKFIPTVIEKVNKLEIDIEMLKKVDPANLNILNTSSSGSQALDMEDIIFEMMERRNRASNIIIFDLKESMKQTHTEQMVEDLQAVQSILEEHNIDKSNMKVFRLGKKGANRTRPLKVILSSPEDAQFVLKNKITRIPGIKIASDQTRNQQEYYKKIKAELNHLISLGDNTKTIKFINNKPVILNKVKISTQPKNK